MVHRRLALSKPHALCMHVSCELTHLQPPRCRRRFRLEHRTTCMDRLNVPNRLPLCPRVYVCCRSSCHVCEIVVVSVPAYVAPLQDDVHVRLHGRGSEAHVSGGHDGRLLGASPEVSCFLCFFSARLSLSPRARRPNQKPPRPLPPPQDQGRDRHFHQQDPTNIFATGAPKPMLVAAFHSAQGKKNVLDGNVHWIHAHTPEIMFLILYVLRSMTRFPHTNGGSKFSQEYECNRVKAQSLLKRG